MLNKLARSVSENVGAQIQEKLTTKYEWHSFSCQSNHEFAIKIPVDVNVSHIMKIYTDMRCPLCESAQLKKQPNL